jgi:hypothetical protein
VAARGAAFSDPQVHELLAGSFVPVAENCTVLQLQQDAEGDLFRLIAEQGHYGGRWLPTNTRQGMYACTADGRLLASCNVHGAERLLPVLRQALERREATGRGGRAQALLAGEGATDRRYRWRPPEGGMILRVWSRDLPRDPAADTRPDDWRKRAVNLDHAWFRPEEVRAMLPPEPWVPGQPHAWPESLARRLARYHFIDNVRGEPPMWRPEEVRWAAVTVRVAEVRGRRLRLEATGSASLRGHARWVDDFTREVRESRRGTDVAVAGELEWDSAAGRFVRFDLLATGLRWGATQYNGRHDDPGPAPIGFAFELVGGEGTRPLPGDATPPQGIWADYFGGK